MVSVKLQSKTKNSISRFRILEEAREAVTKLQTLKSFLSPQDEETLGILMDRELMRNLEKSLRETEQGKFEPLKNILR